MTHSLDPTRYYLNPVDDWLAGDSRRFEFTVTDSAGNTIDISNYSFEWYLLDNDYDPDADAVYDDSNAGIEIVTDSRVDTTVGEFEVRIDEGVTSGEWGDYYQRVVVDPVDDTLQSWEGEVILAATA